MKCKANIAQTDYLEKRGLSPAIIDRYNLGYDPEKKVVVIPYSKNNSYYITRSVNNKAYYKLPSSEAGAEPIYNMQALYNEESKPVYITEAAIDALSIIDAGAEAVSINGTGYTRLLNKLKEKPTNNTLIISLDNDEPGKNATNKVYKDLQEIGASFIIANVSGEHKDPNDALVADRDLFLKAVQEASEQAMCYAWSRDDAKKAEIEAKYEEYKKSNAYNYIEDFLDSIKASVDTPAISTGFKELDKVLDDGLYEGLYVLGALPSLGKTTFVLQIADQIAQQGEDVLIFSLEMARTELMAKSISRITFLECGGNINNAKTTRGITAGKRHERYSRDEKVLINDSINKYALYAQNLYIREGIGDIGVMQIRKTVEEHIRVTNRKPVVVIDYLQILAPVDPRSTDKQNTDKATMELKRISRDFKIPVIGISSLNRDSYTSKISMKAFKESGSIEYSSDVLIGLQLQNDGGEITEDSIDRGKRKDRREIELKILKNRNGKTGDRISYEYITKFNCFIENEVIDQPCKANTKSARR